MLKKCINGGYQLYSEGYRISRGTLTLYRDSQAGRVKGIHFRVSANPALFSNVHLLPCSLLFYLWALL